MRLDQTPGEIGDWHLTHDNAGGFAGRLDGVAADVSTSGARTDPDASENDAR